MKYKAYKLNFTTAVHFGEKTLTDTNISLHADTLFSALCIEAVKMDRIDKLYEAAKKRNILLSDLLPYRNDTYYIPKPILHIDSDRESNSVLKKKLKKTKYIASNFMDEYMCGNVQQEQLEESFGTKAGRVYAATPYLEDAKPYHVETFSFDKDCGLYAIVGYEGDDELSLIEELLDMLSFVGIGGKKSSGLGKFVLKTAKLPNEILQKLEDKSASRYMSLSVCLPKDDELDNALIDAQYMMIKRSGFIYSDTYADVAVKKNDLYVMDAGSTFATRFEGDVYDVSSQGSHVVYRYAKPMFIGV